MCKTEPINQTSKLRGSDTELYDIAFDLGDTIVVRSKPPLHWTYAWLYPSQRRYVLTMLREEQGLILQKQCIGILHLGTER